MPDSAELLFEAALKLPEDERLSLVSRILDSMPAADLTISLDDPQLADELNRRFAESAEGISWSDLRAES